MEFAFLTDEAKPQLYIFEHYNVRTYQEPTQEFANNFALKIRNEIAKTIMRKVLLPKVILILLSSKRLEDPVFSIECMEGILRWLMDEIQDVVKFQTKCLPDKSKKLDYPRIYFLKVLPKPGDAPNNALFKGVRRKFNSNLQNMLEAYPQFGFINVHEITTRPKDQKFFISNQSGILSDEGAIQFWESISQTLKAIDWKVKPRAITKNQYSQWDPKDFKPVQRDHRSADGHLDCRRDSYHDKNTYYDEYHDQRQRYSKSQKYNNSYYY